MQNEEELAQKDRGIAAADGDDGSAAVVAAATSVVAGQPQAEQQAQLDAEQAHQTRAIYLGGAATAAPAQAFRPDTAARLFGLAARPELNGRQGVVVKAASAETKGRVGVCVPTEPETLAIKPANLALAHDVEAVALLCSTVFEQDLLLQAVLAHVERWVRAGILTGVSRTWRRVILEDPDLWSDIVVVEDARPDPNLLARARQQPVMWPDEVYAAIKFMHEGSLPVPARKLADIPDAAWVKRLAVGEARRSQLKVAEFLAESEVRLRAPDTPLSPVPPHGPCVQLTAAMRAVLAHEFPNLERLVIANGMGAKIKYWNQNMEEVDAALVASWVRDHIGGPLRHLHIDEDLFEGYPIFDLEMQSQACLETLQLRGLYPLVDSDSHVRTVREWTADACSCVRNLDVAGFVELADLVKIIHRLPELRRLRWQGNFDDPAREFELLITALEQHGPVIEALYFNIDSAEISAHHLAAFTRLKSSLKEFVFVADECEFFVEVPGQPDRFVEEDSFVTEALREALPQTAVLYKDHDSAAWWVDPLVRIFLPTVEENWHLDGDVRGLENLDWMHTRESQLRSARARAAIANLSAEELANPKREGDGP
jgi:hypothetical protein